MKGDFTRLTFRPERHYSSVRLQQGRVLLDADWNEEHDIFAHRIETETRDVVGLCGAPLHAAGFHLVTSAAQLTPEEKLLSGNASPPAGPLLISAGRCYVNGVLAENERIVSILEQPDLLPANTAPIVKLANDTAVAFPPPAGTYFAYLDVWQRHLTALDEPLLREKALGGPDTATRTKTVWQVKLLQVPAGSGCSAKPAAWTSLLNPAPGLLEAKTVTPPPPPNPCSLSPSGGYRRLENQLYRIEIHAVDGAGNATWKWSRDNGAIVTRWLGMGTTTSELRVSSVGRDDTERFAPNDWVELIDDERDLQGLPGTMVQVASAAGDVVTIKPGSAIPAGAIDFADFKTNPKVRRWGPGGVQNVAPGGFVDLEGGVQVRFTAGSFRTGDYWIVPARTAVGDIEWPFATPQPPFGIRHRYCLLGVVTVAGGAIGVTDCRKVFPPLTELPGGTDLKKHNKYLHGWGVVCGLQVHCGGAARDSVQIEKGYAIACDGTDIFVDSPQQLPVVELAQADKLLDEKGNGKVCVTLAPGAAGSFALDVMADQTAKQTFFERVLEGTLLQDVLEDCLQPLYKELVKAFAGDADHDERVVDEGARNRIAAVNLLVQLANQPQGQRVFISANEHERLVKLYEGLKGLLTSRTFCAIQDDLPEPPTYPFNADIGIGTLYGKGAHRGLRVSPDGGRAYAFGAPGSNRILVLDVKKGEAIAEAELPLTSPTVQDVLPLSRVIVVVSTNANGSTLFLLDPEKLAPAGDPVSVPGRQVVRLFAFDDGKTAFAVVRGEGIVRFDALGPKVEQFAEPFAAFNATGHIATPGISTKLPVYAGAGPAGSVGVTYSHIAEVQLAGSAGVRLIPLIGPTGQALSGDDAIEFVEGIVPTTGGKLKIIHAVVRQPGTEQRHLLAVDAPDGKPLAQFSLDTDGPVRLAATLDRTVNAIAIEETYQLTWVGADAKALDPKDVAPLQVAPSALAVDQRGDMQVMLVYNAASPSVTTLSMDYVFGKRAFDMKSLADYRAEWMAVLNEILRRLLQRLKDCICEHLLVDCPTCDETDRLVLACVEIRGGQVYHICNFHRREVVTFPKLFYWLSAVPIIPLVTNLVERACCTVLGRGGAASSKAGGNFASTRVINENAMRLRTTDFGKLQEVFSSYLKMTSTFGAEALVHRLGGKTDLSQALPAGTIMNRAPATAKRTLTDSGVSVNRVIPLDQAFDGKVMEALGTVPIGLNPGDKVDLYTRNGKVVFYTEAKAAAPRQPEREAPIAPDTVQMLVRRLGDLETGYRDSMAKRDAEISALKKDLAALRARGETAHPPPRPRAKSARRTPK